MQPLAIGIVISNKAIAAQVRANLQELPVRIVLEQPEVGDWGGFQDKLERLCPDVIILEVSGILDRVAETVHRIRSMSGSPAVVAVHHSNDPDTILLAIRSGAVEYLSPPLHPSLRQALERLSTERVQRPEAGPRRARTLGFFSAKGGCGATTIACHTAAALASLAKARLLLADFDLNHGLISFLMKCKSSYSVMDAIDNIHRLDLTFWKALVSNGASGLDIITAPTGSLSRQAVEQERLPHILHFVRNCYDSVIVDLGRGLTHDMMRSMEEIDESYLVTTLDLPALYHAKHITRTLHDAGYGGDRLRLIVNRASGSAEITADELQEILDAPVYAVLPDDDASLREAYSDGKLAPAGSALGRRIGALAAKISGIAQEKPKPKRKFSLLGGSRYANGIG